MINSERVGVSAWAKYHTVKPPKKPRIGARGMRKVKSGCHTCKVRHKKCDEARPACFQCSSTGRHCDFTVMHTPRHTPNTDETPGTSRLVSLPLRLPCNDPNATSFETRHFEYFRHVCAEEFAIYFENNLWKDLVLGAAHTEPGIYHAAIAVGVLTRHSYFPMLAWNDPGNTKSATEYAMKQYNMAIRGLNGNLDNTVESAELAVLASILYINIEFLQSHNSFQGYSALVSIHLHGGLAVIEYLKSRSRNTEQLEMALHFVQGQMAI